MSGTWKKQGGGGAKPVADLVSKLLNPVIERRAGMTMDLLAAWEHIVGEQHCQHSRPEKLHWPRQASDDDPFEPATLIVACEGGHALYLQHDSATIIERINTYFGFTAVARLKLVQKPIGNLVSVRDQKRKQKKQPLPEDKKANLAAMLKDISDPDLRAALEKMGRGVFSDGSDSKG